MKLATSSLQNRRFDSEVTHVYYIQYLRWLNRPYFSSIPSSLGLCLFLNSSLNSVQLFWLIFYNDRPFEPEITMRNSFDIRACANFFKQRLRQRKMVLKKQSHFTKHWLEWHNGAVVKELLARADELGSTSGEALFCFFIVQYFILWRNFQVVC